ARLGAVQERPNRRSARSHAQSFKARHTGTGLPRTRQAHSGGEMKTLLFLAMPLFASRIDDCFAMRGNRSEEAVKEMTRALDDAELRSCAAENLRLAGAVDPLRSALASATPEVRAVA